MTCDSVDLPEPFGPMMAWTSPLFTASESPWRISLSSTRTCKSLTSSNGIIQSFCWGVSALAPTPLTIRFRLRQREEADGDDEDRDNAPKSRQGLKLRRYDHRSDESAESKRQNPTLPIGRNAALAATLWLEPRLAH